MKRPVIRILLLVAYWIPFAFLAMYGDLDYNTLWLYVFMVVDMAILCWACVKYRCPEIVICGNIITAVSSYLCLQQMLGMEQGAQWATYFKPFTPVQMMVCLTVVMALVQGLHYRMLKNRRVQKELKAQEATKKTVKKSHKKTHKKGK